MHYHVRLRQDGLLAAKANWSRGLNAKTDDDLGASTDTAVRRLSAADPAVGRAVRFGLRLPAR